MTEPPSDSIARCLLDGGDIRVVVATTTAVARESCRRHEVLGAPGVALARAATAGLLLATLTKDEERVTLQILGNGPLGSVTVDASASGKVRAYPRDRRVVAPAAPGQRISLGRLVGREGLVGVVRDVGFSRPFSGQTSLVDGEIDTDVENYLTKSEQVESALACDAFVDVDGRIAVSAGILVQALPGSEPARRVAELRGALRAGALVRALESNAGGDAPEDVARRVLGNAADSLALLDVRPVRFACRCTRDRAAGSLALLGEADLTSLLTDEGRAEVICEFCRETYVFEAPELVQVRDEARGHPDRPS